MASFFESLLQGKAPLRLNQHIGQAIFMSETSDKVADHLQGRVAGVVVRGFASGIEEQAKLPAIEFEKIKVEASVEMKFELQVASSSGQ